MCEQSFLSHGPTRMHRIKGRRGVVGLGRASKKKESPREILSSMFRMPPPALYTDGMIHISCAGTVQIDNCKGILLYNENAVELDMGRLRLQLSGDDLTLETVEKGIVLVRGRLFGMTFFYGERTQNPEEKREKSSPKGG